MWVYFDDSYRPRLNAVCGPLQDEPAKDHELGPGVVESVIIALGGRILEEFGGADVTPGSTS